MTDTTLVTIAIAAIAALPPTITAFAAFRQGQRNEKKTDDNTALTAETKQKTDDLVRKTDEIHTLTNSNLETVKKELVAANVRIAELQTIIERFVNGKGRERQARDREP